MAALDVLGSEVQVRSRSVAVYLGSPIWRDQDLFRAKVDGFVPHTPHVNLRIVCLATRLTTKTILKLTCCVCGTSSSTLDLHGVVGVLVAALDVLGREVQVRGRVFELRSKLVDLPIENLLPKLRRIYYQHCQNYEFTTKITIIFYQNYEVNYTNYNLY